ncbi:hypothetical protein [Microbacterium paulum]
MTDELTSPGGHRPYRWRIVQYYQVLAQVGGLFSAASLTLGIFLVGQWQSFAADGEWRAVLILVISIVQLIAGAVLMAYGIARLNRYPTATRGGS